ncbi:MAG: metallophosphatase family protein [Chloroflexota bacterium]|nr:metallophosphatase family protein [Chloroflexota bacterium]
MISDIHANLVALEAVLTDMGQVDQYWCLGDVVGYGPEPNECIQALLELDHVIVVGNHDAGAVGRISVRDFNGEARRAIEWTSRQLDKDGVAYLRSAPEKLERNDVMLVHGSPRDPIWEYITTPEQAGDAFADSERAYVLAGHTHLQTVFVQDSSGTVFPGIPADDMMLRLGAERVLINPGSVGQPRDGDPRAAYAIVESRSRHVEFHRVEYDIAETQRRMRAAGMSEWLTARLAHGR